MKTANVWIFIAVTCGLTCGRIPAHAQPASDPLVVEGDDKPWNRGVAMADRQAARDLFLEGNRLFKIPLITQAIERYTAALTKLKHPAIYFNLALAQISLGQEVEARNNLEQSLEYGEEPLGAKQFQEAQKQLQDVERKLGQIRVGCQTDGAEITLDGVPLFTGPGSREVWVKAKAHEITANKPDYLSQARRVTVSAGEKKSLDLRLITLSEAAESGRRWATWKPWVVVGVGSALAATAGVLHALSVSDFHEYDRQFSHLPCAKLDGCLKGEIPSNLDDRLSRATREQQLALGGYIFGGSVITAGAILLYLNRPRLAEQPAASSPAAPVTVIPTISNNMFGILVNVPH